MTPRKSRYPLMLIINRIGWVLCRALCRCVPGLGRAFNFPLHEAFVGAYANAALEDGEQQIALTAHDLDTVRSILQSAMPNDTGDTSTYPYGYSKARSLLLKIEHCIVLGNSMKVLEASGACILGLTQGQSNQSTITPSILRSRVAPEGSFYTLSCDDDLFQFLANDVLPLLYFLDRHEAEIGALHIVARSKSPPFVWQTLEAISAKYEMVKVLPLSNNERLVDVTALWSSRASDARDWTPTTREEAGVLLQLLSAHYHLPEVTTPTRLLFVSRGDASLRRLKNEAELVADLLDLEFEFFVPKSNDHKSQIEAFRSARIVVAVHGSSLINLLFCQPGTLIIELFPANKTKSAYCWLALKLGLRYRAVVGFSGDEDLAFSVKVPLVIAEIEAELGVHDRSNVSENPSAGVVHP